MTFSSFQCILRVKSGEYCAGVSFTFVVVKIRIDVGRYREENLRLSKIEKNSIP